MTCNSFDGIDCYCHLEPDHEGPHIGIAGDNALTWPKRATS